MLVYSTDEMTGIQALQDAAERKPVIPGSMEKREFNYIRNGTTSLIVFFCVQTGKLAAPYLKQTRTETDFVEALSRVIDLNPDKEHAFVLDNLNIHMSESLVRYVAEKIGFEGDWGRKVSVVSLNLRKHVRNSSLIPLIRYASITYQSIARGCYGKLPINIHYRRSLFMGDFRERSHAVA